MATAIFCGIEGRLQAYIGGGYQDVAGVTQWRRSSRPTIRRAVDFECPTNNNGLPIARICPGPVEISYEVQGYFMSDPATGADYTSEIFDSGLSFLANFLFKKNGSIGIKGVTVTVGDVTSGQEVDGMATFSCTLHQSSADPAPLVS